MTTPLLSTLRGWTNRLGFCLVLMAAAALVAPGRALSQPMPTVQLPDFTELVERVGPSVVNIRTTERRASAGGSGGSGDLDPNIEEFFRRFGIPLPNRPDPTSRPAQSARQRRRTAATRRGLGLHPQRRRIHHDQRARGGRC